MAITHGGALGLPANPRPPCFLTKSPLGKMKTFGSASSLYLCEFQATERIEVSQSSYFVTLLLKKQGKIVVRVFKVGVYRQHPLLLGLLAGHGAFAARRPHTQRILIVASAVLLTACLSMPGPGARMGQGSPHHDMAAIDGSDAKCADDMKMMRELHQNAMGAKTPEERTAMMHDHMKAMQGAMGTMRQTKPGMAMQDSDKTPMASAQMNRGTTACRMDMMDMKLTMMMQMMMDGDSAKVLATKWPLHSAATSYLLLLNRDGEPLAPFFRGRGPLRAQDAGCSAGQGASDVCRLPSPAAVKLTLLDRAFDEVVHQADASAANELFNIMLSRGSG